MKIKFSFLIGLGLIFMLLLISCQSGIESTTVTTTTAATLTSTVVPQASLELTITVPVTATKVEPTTNPDPDSTKSSNIIPQTTTPTVATPTIIVATLTPLPTLVADELELAIEDLIANPMNCDVPCWWGAIPDITTMNEVKHSISPYNFDIYEYEVNGEIYIRLGIKRIEEQNDFEVKIVYNFSDSILTGVTAYSPPISDIFAKYGQPDEVWLSAMNDPREHPPLLWFVIVYLQKGVGIGYVVDGNSQDDVITGCVANRDTERLRSLRLIIPDSATGYKDFPSIFTEERLYLPLEEAVGLTTEDFMQLFNDPTQPQCIETPAELWE